MSISVSTPINNNNDTPNAHIPPPRPAPPVPQHQATPPRPEPPLLRDEFRDEPLLSQTPEREFDLLNLGSSSAEKPKPPPIPEPPKITKIKEPSFDLLGGFDSNFQDPYPDLLGSALNKPTEPVKVTSSGNDLDDIFGSVNQTAPTIAPSKSANDLNGLNLNFGGSSATRTENTFKDPFADLTSSLNPEWKSAKTSPPHQQQFTQPQMSSSASATPLNSTPIHNMKTPSEPHRPDYSRSHFQEKTDPAQKPGKSADIFGDILGSQGYSFGNVKNQGPKSINEMRKVEQAQTMDPERLKVMEWVS